jgi:hypothetical protein
MHNIQRSKVAMHVVQKPKVGGTYLSLIFCQNTWYLERLHSPMVIKMEIVSTHIDRGLNALTMG